MGVSCRLGFRHCLSFAGFTRNRLQQPSKQSSNHWKDFQHPNLAMVVGVLDKLWQIGEIIALVEFEEAKVDRSRGAYKKTHQVITWCHPTESWQEEYLWPKKKLLFRQIRKN